ncbi:RxLR effector protein [Phytophthora megakarya]|uniref:RxLR effector protein n=1 Tax=Phytophthora megakarya TaxID=4795 RepID=A0A225WYM2_9STRA|nr:RxLR effector protein [Phytophthora megakarya]
MHGYPTRHIRAVVIFLSCPGALSTDSRMDAVDSRIVQQVANSDLNDTQEKRYQVVPMLSTTNDPDVRGLNFGSTVTKLNGLTTSGTQKLEKFVENTKLKMSSKQKATHKLFMKFEVGKVEANLFESPQFQNWFTSVNNLYKKNVEKGEMAILTTLMTKYGDDALPKLLTEAKRVSSTNIIARNLEEAQLTKWVANKMTVGSIFNLLKLDEAGGDLFKSPLLSTWVKYAFKLEKQPEETLFFTLKKHFDDESLAKMLLAAKEDSSVAIKLEKVELEQWLSSGKSSEEAFKLLSLNDETGNLLKNPTFNTWVSYVTKADKENPYDVVFAKLSTRYDDENMLKLISSAKQDSKTYRLAVNLEMAQMNAWAKNDKSPSDVFKLLSLQVEEGIDLLKNDMLRVWASYVENLNKNSDKLLLKILKVRNNEEELVNMLAMATI